MLHHFLYESIVVDLLALSGTAFLSSISRFASFHRQNLLPEFLPRQGFFFSKLRKTSANLPEELIAVHVAYNRFVSPFSHLFFEPLQPILVVSDYGLRCLCLLSTPALLFPNVYKTGFFIGVIPIFSFSLTRETKGLNLASQYLSLSIVGLSSGLEHIMTPL
jgi:hypothetical protein